MLTAEDAGATFTLSNAGIFHRFAFFAVVVIVGIILFGSIRIVIIIFRIIVAFVFFRVVVTLIVFGIIFALIFFRATGFRFLAFLSSSSSEADAPRPIR
jgi:hypothetical protein